MNATVVAASLTPDGLLIINCISQLKTLSRLCGGLQQAVIKSQWFYFLSRLCGGLPERVLGFLPLGFLSRLCGGLPSSFSSTSHCIFLSRLCGGLHVSQCKKARG